MNPSVSPWIAFSLLLSASATSMASTITIDTAGEQADEALQAIQELVADRFGEGE